MLFFFFFVRTPGPTTGFLPASRRATPGRDPSTETRANDTRLVRGRIAGGRHRIPSRTTWTVKTDVRTLRPGGGRAGGGAATSGFRPAGTPRHVFSGLGIRRLAGVLRNIFLFFFSNIIQTKNANGIKRKRRKTNSSKLRRTKTGVRPKKTLRRVQVGHNLRIRTTPPYGTGFSPSRSARAGRPSERFYGLGTEGGDSATVVRGPVSFARRRFLSSPTVKRPAKRGERDLFFSSFLIISTELGPRTVTLVHWHESSSRRVYSRSYPYVNKFKKRFFFLFLFFPFTRNILLGHTATTRNRSHAFYRQSY